MFSLPPKPKQQRRFAFRTSFDKLPALFGRSDSPLAMLYVLCKDLPQRIYCAAKKLSKFTNIKNEGARRKLAETSSVLVEKASSELCAGWHISFPRRNKKSPLRNEVEQSAGRLAGFEEGAAPSSGITPK